MICISQNVKYLCIYANQIENRLLSFISQQFPFATLIHARRKTTVMENMLHAYTVHYNIYRIFPRHSHK